MSSFVMMAEAFLRDQGCQAKEEGKKKDIYTLTWSRCHPMGCVLVAKGALWSLPWGGCDVNRTRM